FAEYRVRPKADESVKCLKKSNQRQKGGKKILPRKITAQLSGKNALEWNPRLGNQRTIHRQARA
ncbi:MAG: hypothetical protein V1908_03865, partial [Candidatus Peregrinibacteria bacterium]